MNEMDTKRGAAYAALILIACQALPVILARIWSNL